MIEHSTRKLRLGTGVESGQADNADIRDKIAKGTPLTKEELGRVQDYALSKVSDGTLRQGLQYINGHLVLVRLVVK